MRTRWLFWDEDEVQKKKTLVLVLAILLIILLLGFYAAMAREGGLIAEVTPTALPSPGTGMSPTLPVPTFTVAPPASAVPEAKATPMAGLPTPTPAPPTPGVPELTLTPTLPAFKATATPLSTPTPVLTPPLATPVITTPPQGSVLTNDRPLIAGTAPPDTTIRLYDDGNLVGTTAANPQGDWALIPDKPLAPGEHTVTAAASDDTGRTSPPSEAVTFTIAMERLPTAGGSWFEKWLNRLLIVFP